MRNVLKPVFILFVLVSSSVALADFELKANYDFVTINPGDITSINNSTYGSSYPKQSQLMGYGADAIFYLPVNFGLGLRYESLSNKVSALGFDQTVSGTRTAVLVGYRLINMAPYIGVVGSYGFNHTMKVTNTGVADSIPASQSSYSIGAEGGLKVSHFILGAELGYLSFLGKDMQQNGVSVTLNGNKSNDDLSGLYVKIQAGATF